MRRREFIAGLMGATATPYLCPIGALAQRRTEFAAPAAACM
jgi:hypothetical protein